VIPSFYSRHDALLDLDCLGQPVAPWRNLEPPLHKHLHVSHLLKGVQEVLHPVDEEGIVRGQRDTDSDGKPNALLSAHGLTSRLKPKVASLKIRIDIPDFQ
jgi:hypothetical protein